MSSSNNKQMRSSLLNEYFIYNERPKGEITGSTFKCVEEPMPVLKNKDDILIRSRYVSVDPYLRIQMSSKKTWEKPRETGGVQKSGAVCVVVESNHDDYKVGDFVLTYTGWCRYAIVCGNDVSKIESTTTDVSPSTFLGVLGMPGRTAYFGTLEVVRPKENDVFVVSAAAGAVGQLVGQIAKIQGCRVIGICGSDDKVNYIVNDLGFDDAINYKTCGSIKEALKAKCPKGVDCYFDNVGGEISDAVFELINTYARIGICGQISVYNHGLEDEPILGPRFLHRLIYTRARIEGMLARDFKHRHQEMVDQMSIWIKEGRIKYRETIVDGFKNIPNALTGMMNGKNIGKQIVSIDEKDERSI